MNAQKIAALKALGLSQELIDQILAEVLQSEKSAEADGVRYKGATMSKNPDYDVLDSAYDVLNVIKDRQGMPAAVEAARAMVRTGVDLEAGHAVLKEGKAVYKSTSSPELSAALKDALDLLGEDGLVLALKSLAARRAPTTATKAAKVDLFAQAFMGDLRNAGREL